MCGMRTIICLLMAVLSIAAQPQRRPEPFVPAGMWYGGPVRPPMVAADPAREKEAWRRDLAAIKAAGFNSVTSWVEWAGAERERGRYDFEALDQMLSLADDAGLKVIVRIFADAGPSWVGTRYSDAYVVGDGGATVTGAFCTDHPGVRGDRLAFVGAAARAATRHASLYAIELRSDPVLARSRAEPAAPAICQCPHTTARLRAWAAQRPGGQEQGPPDRGLFESDRQRGALADAASAARTQGARLVVSYPAGEGAAGWLEPAVAGLDYRGLRLEPGSEDPAWAPARLASVLDAAGAFAGDKGWWLGELQTAGRGTATPATEADLRLWGWAAYAKGARAVSFAGLMPAEIAGPDGRPNHRARAAAELAGNLTRNVRLFAPMRARPSRVALLDTRVSEAAGAPGLRAALPAPAGAFYRAMFEQNIQVDIIGGADAAAGAASKYALVYAGPAPVSPVVEALLKAYADGGGTLVRNAADGSRSSLTRLQALVAAAGIAPDIRIDGAPGLVEARFLESPDAFLLVAINHAATPQTVTLHFTPDTPEAIWLNIETGAEVHFVLRADGPSYRHTFPPRDVMLLVRAKRLR